MPFRRGEVDWDGAKCDQCGKKIKKGQPYWKCRETYCFDKYVFCSAKCASKHEQEAHKGERQ